MNKKTFKSFKEFAKDYLKEYDDANFSGVGGFSIGSMDAMKPMADLGDEGPKNQGMGDKRGTLAQDPQKNIKKKKKKDRFQRLENEDLMRDTALYKHMVSNGIIKLKGEK
jgi:hypothetical protein